MSYTAMCYLSTFMSITGVWLLLACRATILSYKKLPWYFGISGVLVCIIAILIGYHGTALRSEAKIHENEQIEQQLSDVLVEYGDADTLFPDEDLVPILSKAILLSDDDLTPIISKIYPAYHEDERIQEWRQIYQRNLQIINNRF